MVDERVSSSSLPSHCFRGKPVSRRHLQSSEHPRVHGLIESSRKTLGCGPDADGHFSTEEIRARGSCVLCSRSPGGKEQGDDQNTGWPTLGPTLAVSRCGVACGGGVGASGPCVFLRLESLPLLRLEWDSKLDGDPPELTREGLKMTLSCVIHLCTFSWH